MSLISSNFRSLSFSFFLIQAKVLPIRLIFFFFQRTNFWFLWLYYFLIFSLISVLIFLCPSDGFGLVSSFSNAISYKVRLLMQGLSSPIGEGQKIWTRKVKTVTITTSYKRWLNRKQTEVALKQRVSGLTSGARRLFVAEGCSSLCRMISIIHASTHWVTIATPLVVSTRNVSRHSIKHIVPWWGHVSPSWETTFWRNVWTLFGAIDDKYQGFDHGR